MKNATEKLLPEWFPKIEEGAKGAFLCTQEEYEGETKTHAVDKLARCLLSHASLVFLPDTICNTTGLIILTKLMGTVVWTAALW